MDVVKGNFEEACSAIEALLKKDVAFVSLDCEFTGIRGRPELITDTPEERYEKMRAVAERFQIIQVGLCFFVPDQSLPIKPDRPRYLAYPYNIYLFPEDRPASINNLVFDVEGINFHKQQKMDFNKWMYEGVPYLSEKEEKEMLSDLAEQAEGRREEHDELQLTMEDTRRTDLALNSINQWLREGARSECVIPDLNPFLRKFMYQKIEELYPSVQMESRSKGRFDTSIVLKLSSLAERSAIREAKLQEGLRIVQRKSGARRIFKLLTSTKAPIIGQNPLFDLLFLYSHFQGDLPAQLNDFKAKITSLFPNIYDTMLLFSDEKMRKLLPVKQSSALESIYAFLRKSKEMAGPQIEIAMAHSKYSDSAECYHEAGYDAYITGYCFAKMLGYFRSDELVKYRNLLYSHKSPYDINLSGREQLHDNTVILVGKVVEGKTGDGVSEKLREYKDLCFTKCLEDGEVFIIIKKQTGHEKVVDRLKTMGDLIIVESWQKYVEGKNQEQEELKSGLARVKKWLPYKSKKASPNHKYQSQFQQQPPQQDTAATAAYAQYGQPGYFPYYMMPSNPQGYSFAYGVYMRPPQH